MGNRLHYETKHVIEYSPDTIGNWNHETITDILDAFGVMKYTEEDCDDTTYVNNFYCDREDIEKMVKKLRKRAPNRKSEWSGDDFDYTNGEIADFFENALKLGEQNSDYVYFSWF